MSAFIIDNEGNYVPVFGNIQVVEQTFEATTTINAASTDAQVPTAKTIYEYVPILEEYGTITINV